MCATAFKDLVPFPPPNGQVFPPQWQVMFRLSIEWRRRPGTIKILIARATCGLLRPSALSIGTIRAIGGFAEANPKKAIGIWNWQI